MAVKEPLADFMNYLLGKFKANKSYVTDNANIVIGESVDLTMKDSAFFPRLEMIVKKMKDDGYLAQQMMEKSYRITVMGDIRRAQDDTTAQDMWDIIGFANETSSTLYGANTDRRNGVTICEGFMQIGGFTEIALGYELYPKTSSFVMECEAELQLEDIHTNN